MPIRRKAVPSASFASIGRAAAIELASLGADVTLLARREDALREAVAALPTNGTQRHRYLIADVSQTQALADAVGVTRKGGDAA